MLHYSEQVMDTNRESVYSGLLIQQIPDIAWIVDERGTILFVNTAFERATGFTTQEVIGKSAFEFFSKEELPNHLEQMLLYLSGNKKNRQEYFTFKIFDKAGKAINIETTAINLLEDENVKGIVVTARNLAGRKLSYINEAAREEEEIKRFTKFLEENPSPVLRVSSEGKILYSNSASKIITSNICSEDGVTLNPKWKNIIAKHIQSGVTAQIDLDIENKYFSLTITPLYSNAYFNIYASDITDRIHFQKELLNAKKEAEESQHAGEQFLARMSHEIRTPMNGIIGLTDILLKEGGSKTQMEYLGLIKQSADNLLVIINDILDWSKIRSGKIQFESTDINLRELFKALYSATLPKAAEKNIAYNYTIDENIPEFVKGDSVRLNQILLNLISNAIKFTEKGRIQFGAAVASKDEENILLQFKVEDSGIGIAEKDQDKIFETYTQAGADTTRKFGGTGLGLPITKQLIELQGGNLQLQSKAGVGSVFYFTLPFSISEKAKTSKISETPKTLDREETIPANGLTVLLVDDNYINRLLVIHLLQQKGYSIIEAESGREAIEKLKEEDIDIVLMDISMPDMDGLEATKIIRKMEPAYIRQTPIIAMTAHAFQEQVQEAIAAGMNDYISKPFKPEELYNKIENQLNALAPSPLTTQTKTTVEEKLYDLAFLNQYYDNEEEFITSILSLYVKETPGSVTKIEECLNRRDWTMLKSLVHKVKTNLLMMGIKKAEPFVKEVGSMKPENVNEQILQQSFLSFKQTVLAAIKQIEKDRLK